MRQEPEEELPETVRFDCIPAPDEPPEMETVLLRDIGVLVPFDFLSDHSEVEHARNRQSEQQSHEVPSNRTDFLRRTDAVSEIKAAPLDRMLNRPAGPDSLQNHL